MKLSFRVPVGSNMHRNTTRVGVSVKTAHHSGRYVSRPKTTVDTTELISH